MKPKIQVLMSTYNGEKYLLEQINSILDQRDVDVSVLIRDDGSKDNTVDIAEKVNDQRVRIIKDKNVGCTKSFLKLIDIADEYDYYAFADQDDVWDKDKLIIGINAIQKYTKPAIYSSNTRIVDEQLQPLRKVERKVIPEFGAAIVKNYVTGCTAVFNKELMGLLKEHCPSNVPYHDWWVNLVALAVGGVSVYDMNPHISYRQHGNNVVGAANSFLGKWRYRFRSFKKMNYRRDQIAKQLLSFYSPIMPDETRKAIKRISNYRNNKLSVIFDKKLKTSNAIDNMLFDLLVLLNKV